MEQTLNLSIIGCGDFLRLMAPGLKASGSVRVHALFDPATEKAQHWAAELGGRAVKSADAIFDDAAIDCVCLFVPPWLRADLLTRAAAVGKHVLSTKPFVSTIEEADRVVEASRKIRCAVIYNRTGDAWIETCKRVLDGGEIGRLALYRHDWIHHYPQWNTWALDPKKNGGPFMDAMIHNMQAARYLMGRPLTAATFFSDRLAHDQLACADTESFKADFDGGCAYLFITWAADLATFSDVANEREHYDIFYLVTSKGWRITNELVDGRPAVVASRDGHKRIWPARIIPGTLFDWFAEHVKTGKPLCGGLVSATMAADDIRLIRTVEKQVGQRVALNVPVT